MVHAKRAGQEAKEVQAMGPEILEKATQVARAGQEQLELLQRGTQMEREEETKSVKVQLGRRKGNPIRADCSKRTIYSGLNNPDWSVPSQHQFHPNCKKKAHWLERIGHCGHSS